MPKQKSATPIVMDNPVFQATVDMYTSGDVTMSQIESAHKATIEMLLWDKSQGLVEQTDIDDINNKWNQLFDYLRK